MEWMSISDIQGFEEFTNYQLNIQGDLRNVKTGNTFKWSVNTDGYLQANLRQAPFRKQIKKHQAICWLFKPNPLNLPTVDHIDQNPRNNNIENLRWATRSEQVCNRGLHSNNTSGESNIRPILSHGKPVWRICIAIQQDQKEEQDKDKDKRKTKYFPRDPNSDVIPQEVIDKRDEMKLKYHGNPRNI